MDLFGRKRDRTIAQLEETIARLRDENEILKERFERMAEREKRALAARQEAHEEVKRLKEKLQSWKRMVEREDASNAGGISSASGVSGLSLRRYTVSKAKLFETLRVVASIRAERETLQTIYLQPRALPPESLLHEYPQLEKAVKTLATETGCAIFHDHNHIIHLLIIPPFPITHPTHQDSTEFETEPLSRLLDNTHPFLVVIAHAGDGFVMLATPNEVLLKREVHSSVKSKHTKGGWSQRRFERLREEEIRHHVGKIRDVIRTMLEEKPRYIVASGDKRILKELFTEEKNVILYRKLDPTIEYVPEKILREVLTTTICIY
ncbi:MAG: Vms1/Ankzf1 family peptidyl-tRNA hydrolase [Methanosarcinales archaeon]